jgi:hypothetical protein
MRKVFLALTGVLVLSAVAFAQNLGTTTTTKSCTGDAEDCTVQGQTILQAVKVEGITLTVPNEIDFTLIDGEMNPGNQPLTASVTWDLSAWDGPGGGPTAATNIICDAWLGDVNAMVPTDGSGSQSITADALFGQINGNGPQAPFALDQSYNDALLSEYAFPIFKVPVDTGSIGSSTGHYSLNVNLFVDSIHNTYDVLSTPGAVYAGVVYVTAAAI